MPPTYADALATLHAWTLTESLRRHAYAVEAAMAYYARRAGEDETLWRMTGLLHDLDYERCPTPDAHPYVGVAHLREAGYPEPMLEAILGHADYTGAPRTTRLAQTLFAVDELSGFVMAVARVRPGRLEGLAPASVVKKLKDRAFAAAVSCDDIRDGAAALGLDLPTHIGGVIEALRLEADRLGLQPQTPS